ncbi:MAG: peptidoglycan-binding protein [Rickettsiales bacterium]|nr:peptidoglycan-binding protein [Rickettsiales bacterium]
MSCENEFRVLVQAVIAQGNPIGDRGPRATGDNRATVQALQVVLQNTRFGTQVTPSGIMDEATRNALMDLQSNAGMRTPSGVVDTATLGMLATASGNQALAPAAALTASTGANAPATPAPAVSTSTPAPTGPTYSPARGFGPQDALRDLTLAVRGGNPIGDGRNDSPQQIEALQAALIAAGRGTNVRQTGQMDAATRAGLTALQTANGLPNTRGVLDQQTLTALTSEVNARAMSDAYLAESRRTTEAQAAAAAGAATAPRPTAAAPTPTPASLPAAAAAPTPAPSAPARGGNLPTPPGNAADWTPLTIGGRANGGQHIVTTQSGDSVAIMRNVRTGQMWVPPSYAVTDSNLQTIIQAGAQQAVQIGERPGVGTLAGRVPEPSQLSPADPALARSGNAGDGHAFALNAEGQLLAQTPGFQPSRVHNVAQGPVFDSRGIAGGRESTNFADLQERVPGGQRPGAAMRTVPVDGGRVVSIIVGPDGIVSRGETPSPTAATAATPASSGRPGLTGAAVSAPLQSPLGVLSQAVSSGNAIGDGRGDSPAQVTALQQALIAAGRGGIVGVADGRNGAATRAAVSAVQAQAGLPQTGVVNAATLAALSSEVAAQGQGAVAQAIDSSPALASALSANPGARSALAQAVAQTPSLGTAIAGNSQIAQAIATTPGLAQAAFASPALAAAMAANPAIATSLAGNPGQVASLASNPSMVSSVVAAFSPTPSVSSTPAGLSSTPAIPASLAGLPASVASQIASGNGIGALAATADTLSSVPDTPQTPSGTPGGGPGTGTGQAAGSSGSGVAR